ncbi:MAG: DUF4442 domain-containing protein [Halobacteriovoraceae bacterium]|nr:DUF4442 domain-containing protein [Halobacteriovoraceae bacterium]
MLKKIVNYWPPFLGSGISIDYVSPEFDTIDVSLKLRFWNRNYVGSHYGGSLYSMCDPFYMLILIERLGEEYIVWDKKAEIEFLHPGKSKVFAHFHVSPEAIQEIHNACEDGKKHEPIFEVFITDGDNRKIARVTKTLWIKKKMY